MILYYYGALDPCEFRTRNPIDLQGSINEGLEWEHAKMHSGGGLRFLFIRVLILNFFGCSSISVVSEFLANARTNRLEKSRNGLNKINML